MKKAKKGRPQIGQPLSVAFTKEQREWLLMQALFLGVTTSAVIRDCVDKSITLDSKGKRK